ncbi:HI1506-related protein [Methylobacterium flocculans]|uniref:HI1506-related protein n=1 Tax=Methylobacterium flocculans TaxID=2984843 RepID=UPI0021F37197|nr:HI1506-related protein [Methylobacterium sp. FF17]
MAKASRQITETAPKPGAARSVADTGTAGAASSVSGEAAGGAASEVSAAAIAAAQGGAMPALNHDASEAAAAELLAGRPEAAARAAEDVAGSALRAPGVGSGPASEPLADAMRTGDVADRVVFSELAANRQQLGDAPAGDVETEVGLAAGIPPNIMTRDGSFGSAEGRHRREDVGRVVDPKLLLRADPELLRHDIAAQRDTARDLAMVAITGAKLAAPLPGTAEGTDALLAEGFDLVVVSRQDGFRRAGVAHPAVPTLRRTRDFSPAEMEALSAEPMLIIRAFP